MWIRVAKKQEDIHQGKNSNYISVYGDHTYEFFFDEETADLLEKDGFLTEMWNKLDALFDWGDCDYFDVEKTKKYQKLQLV